MNIHRHVNLYFEPLNINGFEAVFYLGIDRRAKNDRKIYKRS